jgi:hypothetical protein
MRASFLGYSIHRSIAQSTVSDRSAALESRCLRRSYGSDARLLFVTMASPGARNRAHGRRAIPSVARVPGASMPGDHSSRATSGRHLSNDFGRLNSPWQRLQASQNSAECLRTAGGAGAETGLLEQGHRYPFCSRTTDHEWVWENSFCSDARGWTTRRKTKGVGVSEAARGSEAWPDFALAGSFEDAGTGARA